MPERWPQVCRVDITFELLLTNLFRFHTNEFDEMPCKLDSNEYARLFPQYPNPANQYVVSIPQQ